MLWIYLLTGAFSAWVCLSMMSIERQVRWQTLYYEHMQAEAESKKPKPGHRR